jgi:formylglycine-generating enzyme required for sulfatase activity
MKPPILLAILLSASLAWGGQGQPQVLRDLGPDKSLCLCSFGLLGADEAKRDRVMWLGIIGAAINAGRPDSPYTQELSAGFRSAFEQVLSGTGAFQLLPSERFAGEKNGKPLSLGEAARENALFACVKAESVLGVKSGFAKHVKVDTKWQLAGPSGWTIDIKTEAVSDDTFGVGPDTTDPVLKPIFRHLARHSAGQFLEKLNAMMKAAGFPASMKIADPDEIDIRALVDPGALPQPDPDCMLNSDGKWEKVVRLPNGPEIVLVYIPEGRFLMGSPEAFDDEESRPQHEVAIGKAFWLGKHEVTQEQWKALLASSPSKFKGESFPVDSVSWKDCKRFLQVLNERLGLAWRGEAFRLPTEAEWEYAAKAGTGASYSFSESAKDLAQYAWFDKNSKGSTHPVGGLRPNPWGLYDIYGNVGEWCDDVWYESYEGAPADGTARSGNDSERVWRGGSWDQPPPELRSFYRGAQDATDAEKTVGFRLVLPTNVKAAYRPLTIPASAGATAGTARR